MALRSLIQLRGLIESIPGGSKNIAPVDIQNNTPPSVEIQVELAIGENVFSGPANAKGAVVIFDPTSITEKFLKGLLATDDGLKIAPNLWIVLTFGTSSPIFRINSLAADTGKKTTVIYF